MGSIGIDKMSLCRGFRTVNSSLPLATSGPRKRLSHPARVRDSTPPTIKPAVWLPNLASRPRECPIINGRTKVFLFFLRRPGCLHLHFPRPEETSRTLTWPGRRRNAGKAPDCSATGTPRLRSPSSRPPLALRSSGTCRRARTPSPPRTSGIRRSTPTSKSLKPRR